MTSMLDEEDALALRALLKDELEGTVTIDYYTQRTPAAARTDGDCGTCSETGMLMAEVAALSPGIRLRVHEFASLDEAVSAGIERLPAIVLEGGARGRVRFFGLPAGYEFGGFVQQLIDVANGSTDLEDATRQALQALSRDVHIQVFVTPGCPFCPSAARLAQKMAVESARVTADVIEANEFPDLVERYDVHGVPKVVLNEVVHVVGAQPEARFLQSLLRAAA